MKLEERCVSANQLKQLLTIKHSGGRLMMWACFADKCDNSTKRKFASHDHKKDPKQSMTRQLKR